ncbi:MAG: DUF3479 domain-containing protein, partial [Synechococcus sp. SB0672_bin_6]|nr:DUF3479 domain-containing protein [Synechococcus sp. SB0672_bin_6]
MFTQVRSTIRRVTPAEVHGRRLLKVVYVVLEPQYQSALTSAATTLNQEPGRLAVELSGYLIEELRDQENYDAFCGDVAAADVFIASLIFIEDLAGKVVAAVEPHRQRLKAVVVFPSMPEVMRLNKLGSFSMAQLGQSKSAMAGFMKRRKEAGGASFQDAMLKLLNTLPTVLKYLPVDKAQDARAFMLSFQYWLGGSPDNLRNFLVMLANRYVYPQAGQPLMQAADPVLYPDQGIWHPLAPRMFEDLDDYMAWTGARSDVPGRQGDGPWIGLVLQRSHLVTGDDAHYVALVQELEFRGARVIPVFCGGLDFSKPVRSYFFSSASSTDPGQPLVDAVVSLTGFALVGGPARQDHPRAIETLQTLNRPYMVALPLVFQTTQ